MKIATMTSLVLAIPVCVLIGCMMPRGDIDLRDNSLMQTAPSLTPFDRIWSERTILLGQERRGGGMPSVPLIGIGGDRDGGGYASFPITVQATLMDSALVSEGIREYGALATMNDAERAHFDSLYRSIHALGGNIFIWMQMQTSYTEDFLQMDRWTIFLENDNGEQMEPERIVTTSVRTGPLSRRNTGRAADQTRGSREGPDSWTSSVRDVELYFPLKRIGSGVFLPSDLKHLKLTILEANNPIVRAEGVWILSDLTKR